MGSRRRPQIVAREIVTLDHLPRGRAVLDVGLGADFDTSDTDAVPRWETAGATWWLENLYPWGGVDAMRSRLGAGPPRP